MAYTYEPINSFIPNASMRLRKNNGVLRSICVRPADGYVLHDSNRDATVLDPETAEPTGEVKLGYTTAECSIGYNRPTLIYNEQGEFIGMETTQMQDESGNTVTAYSERRFYAKPIGEVGEGAELSGNTNQPEVV